MKNDRGVVFNVGDKVRYQYSVDGIDTGIVKKIDGYYVSIEFSLDPDNYVIERYSNEILECLSKT